jgi:RNA polymerase sigma factor (sigma-70 family)
MSPVARNNPQSRHVNRERAVQDLEMVQAILSGSVQTWHEFVDRYTGLIMSVLRQQLFIEDYDEIQTVYVDVLKDLYDQKLREYAGNASLSTWLVLVARGKAVDYLRKKRGRRQLPTGYDNLTEFDRRVFQLHFVEGLDFEALIQTFRWNGGDQTVEDVVASVERIVDVIDGRHLKRLEYENDARRRGISTNKLMEYLYHAEVQVRGEGVSQTPEKFMEEQEHSRSIARLETLKARLPEEDQELLALRFEQGWTARKIAEKLDMTGERPVYTALNRALKRLRDLFFNEDPDAQADSEDFSAKIRS